MKKETVKWIVKALFAGLAAFAVLCAACAFYFNVPVRVSNPAGLATSSDASIPPAATHLPATAAASEALNRSHWELAAAGALRVTRDVRIASLTVATDNGSQRVYTDGHVLTVKTFTVAGASKRAGRYTAADLPNVIVGTGAVVVDFMSTMILVR